jgi:hypothetical protein
MMLWFYETVMWHPAYVTCWIIAQVVGFYLLWRWRRK